MSKETDRDIQMRINSWKMCINNCLGQRRQPSLWLPFQCIRSPDCGVTVRVYEGQKDSSILWESQFSYLSAVQTCDWVRQRDDRISGRAGNSVRM